MAHEQSGTVLGTAELGDLTVSDAFVVEPANPAVAAAYLVVSNDGSSDDRMVSVTTPVAASVKPMSESGSDGTSRMVDLEEVVVPGGEDVRFERGEAHLMLLQPEQLDAGDSIVLTLTFDRAGTVTLDVPVVPVTGPVR
jgi:periplasmic copper chaperone A